MSQGQIKDIRLGLNTRLRKYRQIIMAEVLRRLRIENPVDTGLLRDSWRAKLTSNDVSISNDAPYSAYVNDGTDRMSGQHFVETVLAQLGDIEAIAEEEVGMADDELRERRNERRRALRKKLREAQGE